MGCPECQSQGYPCTFHPITTSGTLVAGARVEEFLYEKLDRKVPSRVTNGELLAQYMAEAANDFGPGTPYGESAERPWGPSQDIHSAALQGGLRRAGGAGQGLPTADAAQVGRAGEAARPGGARAGSGAAEQHSLRAQLSLLWA